MGLLLGWLAFPAILIALFLQALLFQFGTMDPNISEAVAMEFYDAASEPKFIAWYDTGHGLNEQARVDRADWLAAQLALEPAR